MTRNDISGLLRRLARTGAGRFSHSASGGLGHRFGGGSNSARHALAPQLEAFTTAFAACHGGTEAQFVESGRALRSLYSAAEALARLVSDRLASMRDALGASRIGGADGIAAVALRELQAGFDRTAQELVMLQSVTAQLSQFRKQMEDIHRIGQIARLSVFLFAVESARTADCQELFGAFVGELRALGDRIVGVAETIDTSASHAQQAQEIECRAMSGSHAELGGLTQKLATTGAATAAAAQALLDSALAALQQAEAHMRQITTQAGEAVFYLQFGDIVRQKTEHIAAALKESATQLAAAGSEKEFRAVAGHVDHVLAIQVGQLELIRTEVSDAQQKLAAAFADLGAATGELEKMLHRWHVDSADARSTNQAMLAFKADLGLMEKISEQGHQQRLGARRAVQSVCAASSQLAVHVDQVKVINFDVHLQALNAIVKAAALKEHGVTLSVLSMHVDWLYRESNTAVQGVVTTLEAILKTAGQNAAEGTAGQTEQDRSALNAGMSRIVSAYDDCCRTSSSAEELVARQQEALAHSRSSVDFLGRHLPDIDQQIQDLAGFRERLAPWVSRTQPAASASLEALPDRYTMHSEREIHARLLQARTTTPPATPAPAAEDNLEMFDLPAAPPAAAVVTPSPACEVAGSSAGSPAASAPPPAAGDNVEFF